MSDSFDPYYRWLGIPPKFRPPDHYRLLGLDQFESDPDVISHAAARQIAHVRTYQIGERSELSQKILNELARAKGCLTDPAKKADYDAQLRAKVLGIANPSTRPKARVRAAKSAEPSRDSPSPPSSVKAYPVVTKAPERRTSAPHNEAFVIASLIEKWRVMPSWMQATFAAAAAFSIVLIAGAIAVLLWPDAKQPILAGMKDVAVRPGEQVRVAARNTNDGIPREELEYYLESEAPANAAINSATGIFSWQLSHDQTPGPRPITIGVRLKQDARQHDTCTFHVRVLAKKKPIPSVNRSPQLQVVGSEPNAPIEKGQIIFDLEGRDPDGDSVSYEYRREGDKTWQRGGGEHVVLKDLQPGLLAVEFRAIDAKGLSSNVERVTIRVAEIPALDLPPNQPPTARIVFQKPEAPVAGDQLVVRVAGTDPDGGPIRFEYRVNAQATWQPVVGEEVALNDLLPGTVELSVRAVDEKGLMSNAVASVIQVAERPPPGRAWKLVSGGEFHGEFVDYVGGLVWVRSTELDVIRGIPLGDLTAGDQNLVGEKPSYKASTDDDVAVRGLVNLLEDGQEDNAKRALVKLESRTPSRFRGEFLVGLFWTLRPGDQAARNVERHLENCLRHQEDPTASSSDIDRARWVACLNNLGVAQVRQMDLDGAVRRWRKAHSVGPLPLAVRQNAGLAQALLQADHFSMRDSSLKRDLQELTGRSGFVNVSGSLGWQYLPVVAEVHRPYADFHGIYQKSVQGLLQQAQPALLGRAGISASRPLGGDHDLIGAINQPSSLPGIAADQTYRDPWCLYCAGSAKSKCDANGCAGGRIWKSKVKTKTVQKRKVQYVEKYKSRCPLCNGTGRVDCQHCQASKFNPNLIAN